MKFEDHYLGLAQNNSQLFNLALLWASAFHLHGGLYNGSLGVGAPSASSSTVSISSDNVLDPCLADGLAKVVDLQLLSNQNHSNI